MKELGAVAILEWKSWGGTAGPRKKVGDQHKCLSWMVIFRCNEDWFAMINPITTQLVNIVRTVARKSSNPLKFCWLKFICYICQSNELERENKHKTAGGGASKGPAKNLGAMAHPRSPLEPPLIGGRHNKNSHARKNKTKAIFWGLLVFSIVS